MTEVPASSSILLVVQEAGPLVQSTVRLEALSRTWRPRRAERRREDSSQARSAMKIRRPSYGWRCKVTKVSSFGRTCVSIFSFQVQHSNSFQIKQKQNILPPWFHLTQLCRQIIRGAVLSNLKITLIAGQIAGLNQLQRLLLSSGKMRMREH